LYIMYTPSHDQMCKEWFLPTLPAEDDFELVAERYEQECANGEFMASGWLQAMVHKVDVVIRGIKENWGSVFIHSDVDIQFFGSIKPIILKAMEGKDMVLQNDHPQGVVCAGFFACRGNKKTLKLWNRIKRFLEHEIYSIQPSLNDKPLINDQDLLNKWICKANPYNIAWDYLPEVFFGGGSLTAKIWKPGDQLVIPEGIVMHHANWTIGVKNKIAQLQYVRTEVENRSREK
jgi:hypothetical protein